MDFGELLGFPECDAAAMAAMFYFPGGVSHTHNRHHRPWTARWHTGERARKDPEPIISRNFGHVNRVRARKHEEKNLSSQLQQKPHISALDDTSKQDVVNMMMMIIIISVFSRIVFYFWNERECFSRWRGARNRLPANASEWFWSRDHKLPI